MRSVGSVWECNYWECTNTRGDVAYTLQGEYYPPYIPAISYAHIHSRSFHWWHWDAFRPRPKKMHQNFYTQDLHTMKNFEIEFLLELLAIHATPAPCLTRLSIEAHADERRNLSNMCSPKKKSRKRTNDSNKRGDYWKFDEFSNQMRDLVIESRLWQDLRQAGRCR